MCWAAQLEAVMSTEIISQHHEQISLREWNLILFDFIFISDPAE
jgi:hypothetical protein